MGEGQKLLIVFPEIHPFWGVQASLLNNAASGTGVEVVSGLLREDGEGRGTYWWRRAGKTWESFPCRVPSLQPGRDTLLGKSFI